MCHLGEPCLQMGSNTPFGRALSSLLNWLLTNLEWWRENTYFLRKKLSELGMPIDGENEEDIWFSQTNYLNLIFLLISPYKIHVHGFLLYAKCGEKTTSYSCEWSLSWISFKVQVSGYGIPKHVEKVNLNSLEPKCGCKTLNL